MTFRPANQVTDVRVPMVFGLAGPAGAGKTKSALLMASGMAEPDQIAMIDTEGGRGLMYRSEHGYMYDQLTEPFTVEAYRDKVVEAIKAGAKVIIIDSASHEHEGPGGLLEQAEKMKDASPKSIPWGKLKPRRNRFINWLMSQPVTTILCFQARPKTKPEKQKNKKGEWETVFIELGFQPICGLEYMFSLTAFAMMYPSKPGVPQFENTDKPLMSQIKHCFPDGQQISADTGKALSAWLQSASAAVPADTKAEAPKDEEPPAKRKARELWAAIGKCETVEQLDALQAAQANGKHLDAIEQADPAAHGHIIKRFADRRKELEGVE